MKVCKGSCNKGSRRCYTTLKRCKWTGREIKTKEHKSCRYVNTENGKRKNTVATSIPNVLILIDLLAKVKENQSAGQRELANL